MELPKLNTQVIYSAGRSVGVVAGIAISTALTVHAIDGNQAQDFTSEIKQIGDALAQIFTGFQSLTVAGAKLIAGVLVVYGAWKKTTGQQTKDVVASAPGAAAPIMKALAEAVPNTVIVTTPALAKATPDNPNIVSNMTAKVVAQ